MEIVSRTENKLLNRVEIDFKWNHKKSKTPSKKEVMDLVKTLEPDHVDAADEFKLDMRIVSMTNGGSAYFELEDTDTDEIRIKQIKKINQKKFNLY